MAETRRLRVTDAHRQRAHDLLRRLRHKREHGMYEGDHRAIAVALAEAEHNGFKEGEAACDSTR